MEQNSTAPDTGELDLSENLFVTATATKGSKKIPTAHELKSPSLSDLEKRDAAQPYRSQDIGNEEELVLAAQSRQNDVNLYNKLIVSTKGYKNNITPELSPEDREKFLANIPAPHKASVIKEITTVDSEMVYEDDASDSETFEWTENQTYRVRTELGSKGQFVFYSTVKEPSERQLELLGGATKFIIERGHRKPVTKITAQLEPSAKLFDELVESIERVTFNKLPVDVKDAAAMKRLNAYAKRSIIGQVVKATSLDLGE